MANELVHVISKLPANPQSGNDLPIVSSYSPQSSVNDIVRFGSDLVTSSGSSNQTGVGFRSNTIYDSANATPESLIDAIFGIKSNTDNIFDIIDMHVVENLIMIRDHTKNLVDQIAGNSKLPKIAESELETKENRKEDIERDERLIDAIERTSEETDKKKEKSQSGLMEFLGGFFGLVGASMKTMGTALISLPTAIVTNLLAVVPKLFSLVGIGKIFSGSLGLVGKLFSGAAIFKMFGFLGKILKFTGIFTLIVVGLQGLWRAFEAFQKGESLSEIVSAFLGGIVESLTFGLLTAKRVGKWFDTAINWILEFWKETIVPFWNSSIVPVFESVWGFIVEKIFPVIKNVWVKSLKFIDEHVMPLLLAIGNFIEQKLFPIAKEIYQDTEVAVLSFYDWAIDAFGAIALWIEDKLPGALKAFEIGLESVGGFLDSMTKFFNWMADTSWDNIFDLVIAQIVIGIKGITKGLIDAWYGLAEFFIRVWYNMVDGIVGGLQWFMKRMVTAAVSPGIAGGVVEEFLHGAIDSAFGFAKDFRAGIEERHVGLLHAVRDSHTGLVGDMIDGLYKKLTGHTTGPEERKAFHIAEMNRVDTQNRIKGRLETIQDSAYAGWAIRGSGITVNNVINRVDNANRAAASGGGNTVVVTPTNTRFGDSSFGRMLDRSMPSVD